MYKASSTLTNEQDLKKLNKYMYKYTLYVDWKTQYRKDV